jgi:CheY-like chemotaxis protein
MLGTLRAKGSGNRRTRPEESPLIRLELPFALAGLLAAVAARGAVSERRGTHRRILVVDDHTDAAESLSELLELTGHEVHTVHDALAAREAVASLRPDAVLLDIGLPGMSGYDIAREIRGQPWGREMLLVALTGWGQAKDRARSREAGFDRHLVKPIDFAELEELLAEPGERAEA